MKWKGYGRKRYCPNLSATRYLPGGTDGNHEELRIPGLKVDNVLRGIAEFN
jgi:hypothetical protein